MKFNFAFVPRDCWVGAYFGRWEPYLSKSGKAMKQVTYICFLPMLLIAILRVKEEK